MVIIVKILQSLSHLTLLCGNFMKHWLAPTFRQNIEVQSYWQRLYSNPESLVARVQVSSCFTKLPREEYRKCLQRPRYHSRSFPMKRTVQRQVRKKIQNTQNPLDFSFKNIQDLDLGIVVRVKKASPRETLSRNKPKTNPPQKPLIWVSHSSQASLF